MTCFPTATGRLDFGASTDHTVSWSNLFSDPDNLLDSITRFGPGTSTYNLPIANLGEVIDLYYWSSAYTQVDPGDVPAGSNFTVAAQYVPEPATLAPLGLGLAGLRLSRRKP